MTLITSYLEDNPSHIVLRKPHTDVGRYREGFGCVSMVSATSIYFCLRATSGSPPPSHPALRLLCQPPSQGGDLQILFFPFALFLFRVGPESVLVCPLSPHQGQGWAVGRPAQVPFMGRSSDAGPGKSLRRTVSNLPELKCLH